MSELATGQNVDLSQSTDETNRLVCEEPSDRTITICGRVTRRASRDALSRQAMVSWGPLEVDGVLRPAVFLGVAVKQTVRCASPVRYAVVTHTLPTMPTLALAHEPGWEPTP
jgi:hypothetical protein